MDTLFRTLNTITQTAHESKTTLLDVNKSLSKVPLHLDSFALSVHRIQDIISFQQNQFIERNILLQNNVSNLANSISEYGSFINNYSIQLNNIVKESEKQLDLIKNIAALTDSQLIIWKDQQKYLKNEYERAPDLTLYFDNFTINDSIAVLKDLIILNNGNIDAKIIRVNFAFKIKDLNKFNLLAFTKNSEDSQFINYQSYGENYATHLIILPQEQCPIIPGSIIINYSENIQFNFYINCESKYH